MTGWLEYFIIGLSTQLTEAHLLEQGKITIQDYESLCPKISRRTLQRDLKYMLEKNVIREKGGGGATDPTRHYVLAKL